MANDIPFEERPTPKDPKETKGYIVKKVITIVLIVFFVIYMVLGGLLIFHNTYYSKTFVNGQSMYPTFNLNATNANGDIVGPNGGESHDGYRVEFGIVDEHKDAVKKIKRGDIVVTYYPGDYDANGELKKDEEGNIIAYTKIKRVVGFPGETVGLDADGELLINGVKTSLRGKRYYDNATLATLPKTYDFVIGEDEIFVMGDNRAGGNSSDSRTVGPIKLAYVQGVFVAREGTCKISVKGKLTNCVNDKYQWPEFNL